MRRRRLRTLSSVRIPMVAGLLVTLTSCAHQLPSISQVGLERERQILRQCAAIFPAGPWQATHIIEASMPFGNETSLIGVVSADRNSSEFRSLLMTEEGIVLFDAIDREGAIEVRRAVPPIDPEGFGRAMVDDVHLLLFKPKGTVAQIGELPTGQSVCRWRNRDEAVDVIVARGRVVQLLRFESGSLVREVKIGELDACGLPSEAWLETTGMIGYSLHLKLLEFMPGSTPEKSDL